jgi:hypothetical protein
MAHYLKKLENRMHHECIPADDELPRLADQAAAAIDYISMENWMTAGNGWTRARVRGVPLRVQHSTPRLEA